MTQFDTGRAHSSNNNKSNVINTLKKWVEYDTTDTEFATFVATIEDWLNNGGKMRGEPYWPNPTSDYTAWKGNAYQVERDSTWNTMLSLNYYHIWTENPLALATYIQKNCTAEKVPAQ